VHPSLRPAQACGWGGSAWPRRRRQEVEEATERGEGVAAFVLAAAAFNLGIWAVLGPGKAEEVRMWEQSRPCSPHAAQAGGRASTAQRWAWSCTCCSRRACECSQRGARSKRQSLVLLAERARR